ncbi:uncharacterized protein LOC115881677 isoform X3 [Sitophilus oryzae]|uniref:Uncharacterized protein LOC115881677 isoform X3 n=1 Tax=Sitophilus oryzae TaxID=7048 RepID=A0A6J2XU74_SITOR|nr:uncharacterized protein LOC115881677 isoform X3 [Sitophilus oryzae]
MSPLIIVGITLLVTVFGDVSHVLQGQAHPPADSREVHSAFQTGNGQDFWWMQDDSPFKNAYKHFKKCADTGKCVTSKTEYKLTGDGEDGFAPIDLQKNVFLNGGSSGPSGPSGPSSYASTSSFSSSGGTDFQGFHSGVKIDLNENPFLTGSFAHAVPTASNSTTTINTTSSGKPHIDLSHNPFLNGQVVTPGSSSSSSGSNHGAVNTSIHDISSVKIDLNKNPFFKNGSTFYFQNSSNSNSNSGSSSFNSFGQTLEGANSISGSAHTNININKNPFVQNGSSFYFENSSNSNGHAEANSSILSTGNTSGVKHIQAGINKIDISNNPFLKGHISNNGQNGGAGGAAVAASGSGCVGFDRACVPKANCVNGVVESDKGPFEIRTKSVVCADNEVCCQLRSTSASGSDGSYYNTNVLSSGKSSVGSQTKITDFNGLSPDQVHVNSASQAGLRPQLNFIGASGASTIKPRDLTAAASDFGYFSSSTPDYSNVNFGDDARFSNLQGLDYLPPKVETPSTTTYRPTPPPRPSCPPGQFLTASGICEAVHRECPPGTRATPSGGCEKLKVECGPGQRHGPYGQCISIQTPPPPTQPPTPRVCPPGQQPGPYGQCIVIHTPPPPPPPTPKVCPSGQQPGPYGQCIAIHTPPPTPPPVRECPQGYRLGPNGQCVPIPTQPPVKTCPPGQKLVGGACIIIDCAPGYRLTPQGECVVVPTQPPPTRVTCGPGQTLGPYGQCISSTAYLPPPSCRPGQKVGFNGQCIDVVTSPPVTTPYPPSIPTCGPGERLGPNGLCVSITTPRPACPPGSFPTAYGGCERPPPPSTTPASYSCPPGTVKTPSGRCESPPTPPRPVTCPSGSFLGPSGNCVRPTTTRTYLPPETEQTTRGYEYPKPTPPFPGGHNEEPEYLSTAKPTVPPRRPGRPRYPPTDKEGSPGSNVPVHVRPPGSQDETNLDLIPVGCAAALKCVQEIYCTAEGLVSPVPVVLTKEQELLRAPTTTCRILESGSVGKCCRDPNYQDPWPSANLVNGVDDGQYAEDDSIGQYKAEYQRFSRSSNRTRKTSRSKRQVAANCGVRNLNSNPPGPGPIDADFAEIPWQAMILRDSNRSLLCGGVIIRPNAVLTSAACVEGLDTSDILIKGGEWKLGIDEEPLPFQIVKVAAISRHPDFSAGSLLNNLALLVLEENLRFVKNVGPLCLPVPNQIPTQNCIATGWGKRILQLHAKGAIMHKVDIDIMNVQQCQQVLAEHFQKHVPNYNTNTLCGFSKIDQCRIDYGSALACADETGRYTLSGVFSWDTGCKQRGQIGAYVAPDVDWIENVLSTPLKQLKRLDRDYNAARGQVA